MIASNTHSFEELESITLPPADKPSWVPLEGTTYHDYNPITKKRWKSTIKSVFESTYIWEEQDGCIYTKAIWDPLPSLDWKDCSGETGTTSITETTGQLWPLSQSSFYTVSYNRENHLGEKWRDTRKCLTTGANRIQTISGVYDVWKVQCKDQYLDKTMYYSPSIQDIVVIDVKFNETARRQLYSWSWKKRTDSTSKKIFTGDQQKPKSIDHTPKKLALLIGNSYYKNISELDNPTNDVNEVSKKLVKLDFEVGTILNVNSRREFKNHINNFKHKLNNNENSIGLFYYAGHAVQVEGENYLIPIESQIEEVTDLEDEAIRLAYIMKTIELAGSSMNMYFIDACRDNPFRGFSRSLNTGLANQISPEGSVIVFSAGPGKVALDGSGNLSPFAKSLINNINSGKHILLMLQDVIKGVRDNTGGKQNPWIQSSLYCDFYFSK